jgi:hypothetical protein
LDLVLDEVVTILEPERQAAFLRVLACKADAHDHPRW